jgi:hypothetical protein
MPRAPLRRRQQIRNAPALRGYSFTRIPSSSPAKADLAKKLANKPIGPRPTDSDDSDRLVVKGNGRRGRHAPRQEIYASGAVGTGDEPGNHPTRAQRKKSLSNATRDIIANEQRGGPGEKTSVTRQNSKARPQSKENLPLVNGVMKKYTVAKHDAPSSVAATSSAVKAPGSVLRTVQPTPTRENSILGTLKPRHRQPSILQTLDQDSSSFDFEDEEEFLPDNESTPFNRVNPQPATSTSTRPTPTSSSRKRKFGASDPLGLTESQFAQRLLSSPSSVTQQRQPTPEPSLPIAPVASLRQSGRKQRESLRDEDDVMALPQSSSSPALSPDKRETPVSTTKTKQQAAKPGPTMTTKELLEAAMPTKRRRTQRERTRKPDTFDILADSDLEGENGEDDSNFLPRGKGGKTRRKEPPSKPSRAPWTRGSAKPKANQAGAGKKPKPSTSHLTTISASAPILTPSTASNRETKSPSQQRSTTNTLSSTDAAAVAARDRPKPSGGSRRRKDGFTRDGGDKENQTSQELSDDVLESCERGSSGSEARDVGKTVPVSKGKWADIDAWDMDFEDVEVMTGSSSPTQR